MGSACWQSTMPKDKAKMTSLYKVKGSLIGGVYFNKPDGTLGETVVQQVKLPALALGEKLIVNGQTTVSCLRNNDVLYPGFDGNLFTASQLYLSPAAQGWWLTKGSLIILSEATGQDMHNGIKNPGVPMQPYYNHDQTGMHEIVAGQTGDMWAVLCVWCSSTWATGNSVFKNEYLWAIPQQTSLSVMRFAS